MPRPSVRACRRCTDRRCSILYSRHAALQQPLLTKLCCPSPPLPASPPQLLAPKYFLKWKQRHQLKYHFGPTGLQVGGPGWRFFAAAGAASGGLGAAAGGLGAVG